MIANKLTNRKYLTKLHKYKIALMLEFNRGHDIQINELHSGKHLTVHCVPRLTISKDFHLELFRFLSDNRLCVCRLLVGLYEQLDKRIA